MCSHFYNIKSKPVSLVKMAVDLTNWDIFDGQKSNLMRTLKLAYTFADEFGKGALVITEGDDVFVFTNLPKSSNPYLKNNLCQQKVKAFAHSSYCDLNDKSRNLAALTDSGKLFTWGRNRYGQLGNGSTDDNWYWNPTLVGGELANKKVVQVACGSKFTLALADDGQVFIFGLFDHINALPTRLTHNIGDSKAVAVACTLKSFFVLLENGQLYVWSETVCGQIRMRSNCTTVIIQMVCDDNHCWILTDDGQIFVSQFNSMNYNFGWMRPVDLNPQFGIAVEIAASGKRFAVRFDDGKVRAWDRMTSLISSGMEKNKPLSDTNPSGFIECGPIIDEAFAPLHRMCRPLVLIPQKTLAEKLGLTLNDINTADVCLQVDGRPIWAHKTVLMQGSKRFTAMFQPGGTESENICIFINDFSYSAIYEFLKYLYTEDCDLELQGLGEVAEFYGHPELLSRCRPQQSDDFLSISFAFIIMFIILFALLHYCFKYY